MIFFVGLHQPSDAKHFQLACISINRLGRRKRPVRLHRDRPWTLGDSGAFTKVNKHGGYPDSPEAYGQKVVHLHKSGVARYLGIVAEDYMCEPFVLAKTGLTIEEHQRLTVARYDALVAELRRQFPKGVPFRVIPVLQGMSDEDYLRHIEMYGERLTHRMWVGVGSVCKRQGRPEVIESLLTAIKGVRPDIRLHGFWREADRAQKPYCPQTPVQRRQHGLELFSSQTWPWRKQLSRCSGIRGEGHGARLSLRG